MTHNQDGIVVIHQSGVLQQVEGENKGNREDKEQHNAKAQGEARVRPRGQSKRAGVRNTAPGAHDQAVPRNTHQETLKKMTKLMTRAIRNRMPWFNHRGQVGAKVVVVPRWFRLPKQKLRLRKLRLRRLVAKLVVNRLPSPHPSLTQNPPPRNKDRPRNTMVKEKAKVLKPSLRPKLNKKQLRPLLRQSLLQLTSWLGRLVRNQLNPRRPKLLQSRH